MSSDQFDGYAFQPNVAKYRTVESPPIGEKCPVYFKGLDGFPDVHGAWAHMLAALGRTIPA